MASTVMSPAREHVGQSVQWIRSASSTRGLPRIVVPRTGVDICEVSLARSCGEVKGHTRRHRRIEVARIKEQRTMTNETASSRSRPRWEVDAKDHGFSIRHVKLDGFAARLMNSEATGSQLSNVMRRRGDHVSIAPHPPRSTTILTRTLSGFRPFSPSRQPLEERIPNNSNST